MKPIRCKFGDLRVDIERKDGQFIVTSPDLKGFFISQPSIEESRRHIPIALYGLLTAAQEEIAALKREKQVLVDALKAIAKLDSQLPKP